MLSKEWENYQDSGTIIQSAGRNAKDKGDGSGLHTDCDIGTICARRSYCCGKALEAGPEDYAIRLMLLKQLLVSCANVTDPGGISRELYKDRPKFNQIISIQQQSTDELRS